MPELSVLVPTYNCAPFLAESLDSMLCQVGPEAEIIVVDDGSTDDTEAVLARYGERITVVRGDHGGLSAARNLALARASGDWVAFQDADDVALPDRLAFQRAYLAAHADVDAVFCNGERLDRPGERVVPPGIAIRCAGHVLSAADIFIGYPMYFQGALIPRRAFVEAGMFDASLRVQPDIEYGYRLLARMKAQFVDRVVFRYRWHTTNNSRDRLGGREDIAQILDRIWEEDGDAARVIGRRRLRARLARHYYRIGRTRFARGDVTPAKMALRRAVALRPFSVRYQLWRWLH